jgi:spermidine synthase
MRRDRLELFLASFLMLFAELVLIRWTSAHVVYLSYFSNFVLLGSFLGIGLGFLRAAKRPDLFRWAPLVLTAVTAPIMFQPVVIDRSGGDLIYFGSITFHGLPSWFVLPSVFLAVTAAMAAIAHGVAVRFGRLAPLDAYRFDILGSLAGVVVFALLALLGTPPLAWAIVVALLFLMLLKRRGWVFALNLIALLGLVGVFGYAGMRKNQTWSPYYRVEVLPKYIRVNGIPHQSMIKTAGSYYETPYKMATGPIRNVLVIGAGNGNDVAAALRAGVSHVDAVEIDPQIQAVGRARHPEHPYSDPRVSGIIDDGRAFLGRTRSSYDLIIFALPDSLTLVSGQSAIRLESYLFTAEAVAAARERLRPGGAFVLYNYYRENWLLDRIASTVANAFGASPCLVLGPKPTEKQKTTGRFSMLLAGREAGGVTCAERWAAPATPIASATDDHPYVYLKERRLPSRYAITLGLVLAVSFVLVRLAGGKLGAMRGALDLFCMGAAFMVLETKSVVQFALLFGTTWFVNALVFAGILATVLIAIEVERKVRIGRPALLFALLFGGLLLAALVPSAALLALSPLPRFFAATALAFFPIFVANLIFAERFRDSEDSTRDFGANLLGAMVGGTLEYLSLVTGYRALLGLVALLYLLAWIFAKSGAGQRAGAVRA